MPLAVLGLGSNLGNREETIALALDLLEKKEGISIERLSSIYETEPFDVGTKQENYLNCCLLVTVAISPMELLEVCHEIERVLGRVRIEYHGARTLDMDILLYEDVSMDTEVLTIPHREILFRTFVLIPLADLFPDHKALGLEFFQALKDVDKSGVWLYK